MSNTGPIATHRTATGIPTGRLAMWWLMASEIFIFGGLIMCFLLYKFNNAPGFEDASLTSTPAGAFNTFVLLTSSLTIVLAHASAERGDTKSSFKFIWCTIFGGLIFMLVKTYEYTGKISAGYNLTENIFWSFYYTATGLHAIHVLCLLYTSDAADEEDSVDLGGRRIIKKNYNLQRVELVGIYWHFVDIVWIFLFPILYIANF